MKEFTQKYIQHLAELDKAQKNFDAKPCTKTATILSDLKNKRFRDDERFTPEYLKEYQKQRNEAAMKDMQFLEHLLVEAKIIQRYEQGKISSEKFINLIMMNDIQHNVHP